MFRILTYCQWFFDPNPMPFPLHVLCPSPPFYSQLETSCFLVGLKEVSQTSTVTKSERENLWHIRKHQFVVLGNNDEVHGLLMRSRAITDTFITVFSFAELGSFENFYQETFHIFKIVQCMYKYKESYRTDYPIQYSPANIEIIHAFWGLHYPLKQVTTVLSYIVLRCFLSISFIQELKSFKYCG